MHSLIPLSYPQNFLAASPQLTSACLLGHDADGRMSMATCCTCARDPCLYPDPPPYELPPPPPPLDDNNGFVLATHSLLEHTDVLPCSTMRLSTTSAVAASTSIAQPLPLRFDGALNVDITEFQTNLLASHLCRERLPRAPLCCRGHHLLLRATQHDDQEIGTRLASSDD